MENEILNAMKEAGKPVSAGEVEKLTGFDRKDIDKAFKNLKKDELIVSPVRCKWEPVSKYYVIKKGLYESPHQHVVSQQSLFC